MQFFSMPDLELTKIAIFKTNCSNYSHFHCTLEANTRVIVMAAAIATTTKPTIIIVF